MFDEQKKRKRKTHIHAYKIESLCVHLYTKIN